MPTTTLVARQSADTTTTLLAATGIAWTAAVTLVATTADSDPVAGGYDAYNRVFTLALALLVAGAWSVARRLDRSPGRTAARALVAGPMLMLAGNLLEFWGSLLSGQPTAATAERLGNASAFWGSSPGFAIFMLGGLTFLGAAIALATRARTWGTPRGARLAVPAAALLALASTALWAVTPAAAAAAGVGFAFAWLRLQHIASSWPADER